MKSIDQIKPKTLSSLLDIFRLKIGTSILFKNITKIIGGLLSVQVLNVGLRGLTLAIRFALLIALSFYLPPSMVGLFGLIAVTVNYALYFVGFDFYAFSNRDLLARPKQEWSGLLLSQGSLFIFLYLIVLPGSLFLFYYNFLPWWTSGWVLTLIVSEHLAQEMSRLAIAMGRPLFSSVLVFLRQGLWVLFLLLFLSFFPEWRELQTVVLFWTIGSISSVIFGVGILLSIRWKGAIQGINFSWILKGLAVAFPLLVATIAFRAIMTVDRYAFEAFNGPELLGPYSLFMGIAGALLTFMDAGVFAFLYPKMIRRASDNQWVSFHALRARLRKQTFIWTAVMVVFGGVGGPLIFSLLPDFIYIQNWPLYLGLLAGMLVFVLGMVPHYTLYSLSIDQPIIYAHISGLVCFLLVLVSVKDWLPYWAVVIALIASGMAIWLIKEFALRLALRRLN